jgi:hypothetical protein
VSETPKLNGSCSKKYSENGERLCQIQDQTTESKEANLPVIYGGDLGNETIEQSMTVIINLYKFNA